MKLAESDHVRTFGRPMEFAQYLMRFPVTGEPAEAQAERIFARLRRDDPRRYAEICGGYTEPR